MIEAILAANGFPETVEFIEQHHTKKEPVELANQARRSAGETNDLRPGDIVKGEAGPSA